MENKAQPVPDRNTMSIVGVLLLLIPIIILVVWIYTFNSNPNVSQSDKVKIFSSYFPAFLQSSSSISCLSLAAAVGAIVFTIMGRKRANATYRIIGVIVIVIASLTILMGLFSML